MTLDVSVSPWLGRLLDEVAALSEQVAGAAPAAATVAAARDRAAVATLRLDGSPIEDVPPKVEDLPVGTTTGPARGGWLEVLRSGAEGLEEAPDEVVLAVEHHGARAGLDALDLATTLRADPLRTLTELHRRVTEGLLDPDVAGAVRRTEQAVHDASVGRVLFFPVDPAHIAPRLQALGAWVADTDAPDVVVSGVLQHQLLDVHPWEAANGRTARIAARLLLATGTDPEVVSVPEEALLRDAIGYLDEVGRARRLGTPAPFVERWAEAVAQGLRESARELGTLPEVEVPDPTAAFVADRHGTRFTIVEHRDATGLDDRALDAAVTAGLVRRVLGTRGLRFEPA